MDSIITYRVKDWTFKAMARTKDLTLKAMAQDLTLRALVKVTHAKYYITALVEVKHAKN